MIAERKRSNALKSEVKNSSSKLLNGKDLLYTSRAKEVMVTARAKVLDRQELGVADHLHILRSMMSVFQSRVADDVKDGFTEFCRWLIISTSNLIGACRRVIVNAMIESMDLFKKSCKQLK